MNQDLELDPKTQLYLGWVIVLATAAVQGVILMNNANFTLESFGWAFLVIYLAAATCYVIMPWIEAHIEEFAHTTTTRLGLLVFCFWITFEEHVHAAQKFHAPEGAATMVGFFLEHGTAKLVATGLAVAALLAVVEILFHFQQHGAQLIKRAHKRLHRSGH